jgi:putative membrane protein
VNKARHPRYLRAGGSAALWFALAAPPAAWFSAQAAGYFVVPHACRLQQPLPLHLIAAASLCIIAAAGYTAYGIWRASGGVPSDDENTPTDRSRFLAELALGGAALFVLTMVGQWVAVGILGPCLPLPRAPFTPDALSHGERVLFAHLGPFVTPESVWNAWSLEPGVLLPLIWGGVLYGAGARAAPSHSGRSTLAFAAGCLILAVALLSPLHALAEMLFSAHMAQHTLLIGIAAPLIVLGRPLRAGMWALPRSARRAIARGRVGHTIMSITHIGAAHAFVLHAAALWVWHLPALYQASLGDQRIHAFQHACFLITALVFWSALLDARHRSHYGIAVLYLFATTVHTSVLGALMTVAPAGWYPRYAAGTEAWGMSLLEDQQLAGLIMWMPAGLLYTAAALLLLAAWLRESETRALRPSFTAPAGSP